MKLADYDAAKYAESRERVENGLTPLRRTVLPGTIKSLPESLVLTADSHFGAVTLTQPQIVMLDDETLHLLQRSMDADVGHVLRVAARNPFITSVVVVTDALSRSYWSPYPDRSNDSTMWAKAFGLDPQAINTPKALFRLASETQGRTMFGLPPLKDDGIVPLLLNEKTSYATSYEALSLMDKLEDIGDMGGFYMRSDPLLRDRYLCNGEVVTFTDVKLTGSGKFKGVISSPCKLRVAKPLVVIAGREMFNTEITEMSYRKGDGLTGSIKSGGKGLSIEKLMQKEVPYLTTKAYSGNTFTPKLTPRERRHGREVPLDITLAAFGGTDEEENQ